MIKINLGCGKRNFGRDWVHIDGGNHPHLNSHNITELAFANESVDLIYASHVLEYFDREEAIDVLSEWYRVLKQGSILRLAVPDFGAMTQLYVDRVFPIGNFLGPLYGKMPMGDTTIYHKTIYDFESLYKLLDNVWFKNIKRYDWWNTDHSEYDDHSQAYLPHMDKEDGILISLNVEATK